MQTARYAARYALAFVLSAAFLFTSAASAENLKVIATTQDSQKRIVMVAKPTRGPASPRQIAVGRLLPDGSTDTTFGYGGWTLLDAPWETTGEFTPTAVLVTSIGAIVTASLVDGKVAISRFLPDGQPQWNFFSIGTMVDNDSAGYRINALLETPDGGLLGAGSYRLTPTDDKDVGLLRYQPYGPRDVTFGMMGAAVLPLSTGENEARALVAVDNGKVVIAGVARELGQGSDFLVARITSWGVLDPMFGTAGKVTKDFLSYDDDATSILRMPDGKLLIGGRAGNESMGSQDLFGFLRLTGEGQFINGPNIGGGIMDDIAVDWPNDADSSVTALAPMGTGPEDFIAGGVAYKRNDGKTYFVVNNFVGGAHPNGMPAPAHWETIGPRTYNVDEIVGLHLNAEYRVVAVGNRSNALGTNPYRIRYVATTGFMETDFDTINSTADTTPDLASEPFNVFEQAPLNAWVSWQVSLTGFNAPLRVVVTNGEWSPDCGWDTWTTAPGWVLLENTTICIRHMTSWQPATMVETQVQLGDWHGVATSSTQGATPITYFVNPPMGTLPSTTATIVMGSTAYNPIYQCATEVDNPFTCTAPYVRSGLSQGDHQVRVRSRESPSGAWGAWISVSWRVDSIAPDTTITSGPGISLTPQVVFAFTSNEPAAAFQCRFDAEPWTPCASSFQRWASEGNHMFEVRAVDAAGNVDPTPATRAFTVWMGPPETTITGGPSGTVASMSATFTFTGAGGGTLTFECRTDYYPVFVPCTSPMQYNFGDGPHTFEVRSVNEFGGRDPTPALRTWTVDMMPPFVTIDSGPELYSTVANPVIFAFSASEPGVAFQCRSDPFLAFAPCVSPVAYTLASGGHSFEVRATDPAGNIGPLAGRPFWVDAEPPETYFGTLTPPTTPSTSATFNFGSSEMDGAFQCSLDGSAFAVCTQPLVVTGLAPGPHVFKVRAVDVAGNVDPTPSQFSWIITPATETTITSGPTGVTSVQPATFAFTANMSSPIFECRRDGLAFTPCTSPITYNGLQPGAHTFEVRANTPQGGLDPTPAARTWTFDPIPPNTTITGMPPTNTTITMTTFTFTSSEVPSTFECKLDGGNFGPCTSPLTFPSLSRQFHIFQVRAKDAAGNVDPSPASYSWTIH